MSECTYPKCSCYRRGQTVTMRDDNHELPEICPVSGAARELLEFVAAGLRGEVAELEAALRDP